MARIRAAGLEVDERLAGHQADRTAQRQVDPARQHDATLGQLLAQRTLGNRSPGALQGREALEELGDPVDRLAAQLRGQYEPLADPVLIGRQLLQQGLDELVRIGRVLPVLRVLDGLVRHGACGDCGAHAEGLTVHGQEACLAAVYGAEGELGDPQLVLEGLAERAHLVFHLLAELGTETRRKLGRHPRPASAGRC